MRCPDLRIAESLRQARADHDGHVVQHEVERRVRCEACGVKTVSVPWSREGSGFTLLFEAHVMDLIPAMPVAAAARMIGEHDTRLWRIIHHDVDAARARADHGGISRVAFDETAARRGHDYRRADRS